MKFSCFIHEYFIEFLIFGFRNQNFTKISGMNSKHTLYMVAICLILILSTQAYWVYDYYRTTKNTLQRESDMVLKDAFLSDLSRRKKVAQKVLGQDTIAYSPEIVSPDSIVIDAKEHGLGGIDLIGERNLLTHMVTSRTVPLTIDSIGSQVEFVLKTKKIRTDFLLEELDEKGGILSSCLHCKNHSYFTLSSQKLLINPQNKEYLQLTFINPLHSIVKRMAMMLFSSCVFAIFCVFAFLKLMQILASQKKLLNLKNEFLGSTAHELKRPVVRLRLAIEKLAREPMEADREKKERYWAISKEAVCEITDKINMIMTLSMAEEGIFELEIRSFDLILLLQELRDQFTVGSSKPVHIDMSDVPEQLWMNGDEHHIRQVIANLMDNAVKYSGAKVNISICARLHNGIVCLVVADDGTGIAPEKQELVFSKYVRLHAEEKSIPGFGIGLNYVKTVIEKHGGKVTLISELEQGSEFVLSFPVGDKPFLNL